MLLYVGEKINLIRCLSCMVLLMIRAVYLLPAIIPTVVIACIRLLLVILDSEPYPPYDDRLVPTLVN